MRQPIKIFIMIALLSGVMATAPRYLYAVEDAIIAVVNDEVITLKDLRNYIHSTYVSLVTEGLSEDQLKQAMLELEINGLERLIEDKLILSRANQIKLEVKDKLINDRMDEIKKRYISEDIFLQSLIRNGATITDLRNKILEQLKIKYVVDFEVRKKIYVNPQEVTNYYEKNSDKFTKKERVNLDSIFVKIGLDKEEARKRINQAREDLKNGKDFQEVAKTYSDAPSVGMLEKGQALPVVENTVFNLKDDEISPVIEVEGGFYIFKLLGRKASEKASLEEVKDKVYNIVYRQKFKKNFDDWIAKLKKEAYIEIKK